jgi:hypothetical protein
MPGGHRKTRILNYHWVCFVCLSVFIGCVKPVKMKRKLGYVTGKITNLAGEPVEGSQVYIYKWLFDEMLFEEIHQQEIEVFNPRRPNNDAPYQGAPDFMTVKTGADGEYQIGLPPGTYCLVARKQRNRNYVQGPTNPVDLSSLVSEPIDVELEKTVRVSLRLLNTFWDISHFDQYLVRTYLTGFSGRVLTSSGVPVSGVIVTASGEASQSRRKPDFVSFPTDNNGNYTLYVFFEDVYHLGIKRQAKSPYQTFGLKDGAKSSISIPQGQIIPMVDLILDEKN